LILGQYNRQGTFAYAGFCGNGLSEQVRAMMVAELQAMDRKTCPFRAVPDLRDDFREPPDTAPQWVRPTLVVEVEYRQRLRDGLRHAVLKGFRADKRPGVIRRSVTSREVAAYRRD
jgi:ATP-dependent DNA ligase